MMRHAVFSRVLTAVLLFVPPLVLAVLALTGVYPAVPLLAKGLLWGLVGLMWGAWAVGVLLVMVTDTLPGWRYQRWWRRQQRTG